MRTARERRRRGGSPGTPPSAVTGRLKEPASRIRLCHLRHPSPSCGHHQPYRPSSSRLSFPVSLFTFFALPFPLGGNWRQLRNRDPRTDCEGRCSRLAGLTARRSRLPVGRLGPGARLGLIGHPRALPCPCHDGAFVAPPCTQGPTKGAGCHCSCPESRPASGAPRRWGNAAWSPRCTDGPWTLVAGQRRVALQARPQRIAGARQPQRPLG